MQAERRQPALKPHAGRALLGRRVAFTGRLATLSMPDAHRLTGVAGGHVSSTVTPRTHILVVGMRGWPLMHTGHLTAKLAQAERLRTAGRSIRVLSEPEFREALGLEDAPIARAATLDADQVCTALGIDASVLRRWELCGLVRSQDGRFDFQDLVSLRTVTDLVTRGANPVVIRRSLDALAPFLPGVDRPLAQLKMIVSDSGQLVAELGEALLTTTGQLELRFDAVSPRSADACGSLTLARAGERSSADWIDVGLEHEESGELKEAEDAYRAAVAVAPNDPLAHFNLGNVLLATARLAPAGEHFLRAATLDPSHAQAWFNLAHSQDALGDHRGAMSSLRRAIAADPTFADAYFNLADLAERTSDAAAALGAWSDYLSLDPMSEWGAEARRRLKWLRRVGAWD